MLARREHPRAELARKLADDATPEDLQAVLDHLERSGLLSDARRLVRDLEKLRHVGG